MRTETDVIGNVQIDDSIYYGINTLRAKNNFNISGIKSRDRDHIKAMAIVKKGAAYANFTGGKLSKELYESISKACDRLISGEFDEQFVVDVFQAGAGTSFNMNTNEILANLVLESLNHKKGEYKYVHPNDVINMSQSTNDIYPTMMRVSIMLKSTKLIKNTEALIKSLKSKYKEFANIYKTGRTHLQDAVRVTLGDEFNAWAFAVERDLKEFESALDYILELNIGGTAVGNGANTPENYKENAVKKISEETGFNFRPGENLMGIMQFMTDFSRVMNSMSNMALDLSKISDDLRLLYSGPGAGLHEIVLPAVQQGSSIMPGKINPSIAEAMNMICHSITGSQQAVNLSVKAGQLELNVMMPHIDYEISKSLERLANGIKMLDEEAIQGIIPDRNKIKENIERSFGSAALLNPYLGYDTMAKIVEESLETGKSIKELVLKTGKIDEKKYNEIFNFLN
ncbi:MAG: aspartate ammonia-lyase [Ferroplasma sp.]|uniref:aspartate ammonia-lyase n=1 Tax=Ferroplasma sp. TaxID=2591003 RepID=UPI0028168D85|nr:aspartate ammonia-lyase [Ferroplasma sp.]WMT51724.1 MAG: aspartate ammonia-lyase [Ferroplasma sp.]